jgi:carotenoid 1,2-hydratase
MRGNFVPNAGAIWPENHQDSGLDSANDSGGFRQPLSVDPRGALWPGDARLESVVRAGGVQDQVAGSLSCGGQRPSWTRSADGGSVGSSSGHAGDAGPCFDQEVVPGGYAWWYVDAISDDGQHGLTVIAFIGSVFSPYYGWAGRRDPLDHCAFNVALYGPRASLWSMTERRRSVVTRSRDALAIGLTTASWEHGALVLNIHERAAPIPRRIRGRITVHPAAINLLPFVLEERGQHWWRPLAPRARVTVEMSAPALRWQGPGYVDQNAGAEPIEQAFSQWTWSRAATRDGAAIIYDAVRRREPSLSLALAFDRNARFDERPSPPSARLPRTRWRLARTTRADEGRASAVRSFEDTPFYSRGLVAHTLFGEPVESMHESLSLDRFANPLVRLMLPFRMPRL